MKKTLKVLIVQYVMGPVLILVVLLITIASFAVALVCASPLLLMGLILGTTGSETMWRSDEE
jgi:hypothetical protein